MKIEIFHNVETIELAGRNIPAIFDPARLFSAEGCYRPGDLVAPVLEFELPDCFAGGDHQYIAELCWVIGQNDAPMPHPGTPLDDVKDEYFSKRVRSLCMGDVVVIGGIAFFAATMGWLLCPGDGLNLSSKTATEHQRELRANFADFA